MLCDLAEKQIQGEIAEVETEIQLDGKREIQFPKVKLTVEEVSREKLKALKRHLSTIRVIRNTMETMPDCPPGSFDY